MAASRGRLQKPLRVMVLALNFFVSRSFSLMQTSPNLMAIFYHVRDALYTYFLMNGSPGGGLNPRPHTYKACALTTTELRDNWKNGAEGGIRTHDDVSNPDYKSGAIDRYATSALLYRSKNRLNRLPLYATLLSIKALLKHLCLS